MDMVDNQYCNSEIEQMVDTILQDTYGGEILSAPINLSSILKVYGINLRETSFSSGICGEFNRNDNAISLSTIKSVKDYIPMSFTVAHCLGHYFLHPKKEKDTVYRRQLINLKDTKEEYEANIFASYILMPKRYFKTACRVLKYEKKLATLFGVTNTLIQLRLENLN